MRAAVGRGVVEPARRTRVAMPRQSQVFFFLILGTFTGAVFLVGEGIERKKDDFAAEVMAQVGHAGAKNEKTPQPS